MKKIYSTFDEPGYRVIKFDEICFPLTDWSVPTTTDNVMAYNASKTPARVILKHPDGSIETCSCSLDVFVHGDVVHLPTQ